MLSEWQIVAYCTAMGFVMAGTIASFYQLVTSEPADFFVTRANISGWAVAVLLIMFGGPAIVARKIWAGVKTREMSPPVAAVAGVFAAMWSVCAGIFFVSLLATV